MAEPHRPIEIQALTVGAPVGHRVGHAVEEVRVPDPEVQKADENEKKDSTVGPLNPATSFPVSPFAPTTTPTPIPIPTPIPMPARSPSPHPPSSN